MRTVLFAVSNLHGFIALAVEEVVELICVPSLGGRFYTARLVFRKTTSAHLRWSNCPAEFIVKPTLTTTHLGVPDPCSLSVNENKS